MPSQRSSRLIPEGPGTLPPAIHMPPPLLFLLKERRVLNSNKIRLVACLTFSQSAGQRKTPGPGLLQHSGFSDKKPNGHQQRRPCELWGRERKRKSIQVASSHTACCPPVPKRERDKWRGFSYPRHGTALSPGHLRGTGHPAGTAHPWSLWEHPLQDTSKNI